MRTREEAAAEIERRLRAKAPTGAVTPNDIKRIAFEVLDEGAGLYGPMKISRDPSDPSRIIVEAELPSFARQEPGVDRDPVAVDLKIESPGR